jgi:hypothetical protein
MNVVCEMLGFIGKMLCTDTVSTSHFATVLRVRDLVMHHALSSVNPLSCGV